MCLNKYVASGTYAAEYSAAVIGLGNNFTVHNCKFVVVLASEGFGDFYSVTYFNCFNGSYGHQCS